MQDLTCAVPGCCKARKRRQWCDAHYRRWLRHGDPAAGRNMRGEPKPPCSIGGCDAPAICRTWCENHYARWRRYGSPTAGRVSSGEPVRWLAWMVKSAPRDGCWLWPFGKATKYGSVMIDGARTGAHRLALQLDGTPLRDDQVARHKCDNPRCVNPDHIEPGSHADNTRDMYERGRSRRGRHEQAVLSCDDVREIVAALALGAEQKALAAEYGVTPSAVHYVAAGKNWAWLTGLGPDPVLDKPKERT